MSSTSRWNNNPNISGTSLALSPQLEFVDLGVGNMSLAEAQKLDPSIPDTTTKFNMFEGLNKFLGSDALSNIGAIGSGVNGLMGAWNSYNQMNMMQDQFDAAKAFKNRDLKNQAAITNRNLKEQANTTAQLYGKQYGSLAYNDHMKNAVQVDGSAIG